MGRRTQFTFQFLDSGKAALQLLGKASADVVLGDANRFTVVFKRIFGNDLVFRFAQNETDTGLVIGMGANGC